MLKSIPLNSLVPSERNVRRTSDPAADAQLRTDIAARGLLQNLVVTPAKPRGKYAVEAGGRRLHALQALQAEGALPKDYQAPCLVLGARGDPGAVVEASLAENLQRLAMNPADECLAFGRLIDEGSDPEGVARRFGLTVRHVEGRLRLAGLHPTVFEALGAGAITLDAAKAYAVTSDQERQLRVFEQLSGSWSGAHPDSIRRMMVSATVPASDRRLRFVGEEAYLAAGGRLERDLFADEADTRVLDVVLLEQLATDKLEVEAAWLANEHGYAFVRASLDTYVQPWRHEDLRRAGIAMPEPSAEERAEVAAIMTEMQALTDLLEVEDTEAPERDGAEAKLAALEEQLQAIEARPPVLDAETRATVGFFLLLDEGGTPRLDPTPYARVDDATDNAVDDLEGRRAEGGDKDGAAGRASSSDGAHPACSVSGAPSTNSKLPQRLVEELAMQRRDILAYHLARDTELAFDFAVFLMVKDEGGYCYDSSGSSLSARVPNDPVLRSALPDAPIGALLAQLGDSLDRSWIDHATLTAKFDAFRSLPREARDAWLGAAVARTLEASAGAGGRTCTLHDHLGHLLAIDVAQHWRPTALNWFDRVPKARCLAALTEVGGTELAERHARTKKAEIAEACEKLFAGDGIVEAEVKTAALAWIPEPMRFAASVTHEVAPPWIEEAKPEDEKLQPGPDQADGSCGSTVAEGGDGEPGPAEEADLSEPNAPGLEQAA